MASAFDKAFPEPGLLYWCQKLSLLKAIISPKLPVSASNLILLVELYKLRLRASDMGRTSCSVLIHFMAEELPPWVKMFGSLYAVFYFRPKVEACVNCRQVGHRRNVCPLLNRLTCPGCGQKHPADHPYTPEFASVGKPT
ncbi:hypothetical protein HPB49_009803 [Dermacentor silvarum]|uniref:Uncharacterized protein n=1 Tax=Dermacentor silvarum TaxID=543639 RepID=A0ACB8DNZ3_DERSI|nr:hypothetical protein HPB49_009803 [Dermacentor silvarum]